jgi:nucleotide-binding universal stress UspA family protein
MNPPNTIVAATDLSAPARHAVERAFHLASQSGSSLRIVHGLELDLLDSVRELFGTGVVKGKAAIKSDAGERLAKLVNDTAIEGVAAQYAVVLGNALDVIVDEGQAQNAALLVLGARGESYLRHSLLGSTAARVIRKSPRCPVLVVKQTPHEVYRHVLVPVDFSPASLRAIQTARHWAPTATLVLLHALQLPYEGLLWRAGVEQQQITAYVQADKHKQHTRLHTLATQAGLAPDDYLTRVLHGDAAQHILATEQEYDADLIVLGKHGNHLTEELLLGSVTRHVLAQSQGDVLVIHDLPDHVAEKTV